MMNVVEFKTNAGDVVKVLISPGFDTPKGPQPGGNLEKMVSQAKVSLDEALAVVKPMASAFLGQVKGLDIRPDEVSMEFGLQLNAEAGALLAKAGAEAHIQVTLTWKRDEPKR